MTTSVTTSAVYRHSPITSVPKTAWWKKATLLAKFLGAERTGKGDLGLGIDPQDDSKDDSILLTFESAVKNLTQQRPGYQSSLD